MLEIVSADWLGTPIWFWPSEPDDKPDLAEKQLLSVIPVAGVPPAREHAGSPDHSTAEEEE